jgi:hypothetical protein
MPHLDWANTLLWRWLDHIVMISSHIITIWCMMENVPTFIGGSHTGVMLVLVVVEAWGALQFERHCYGIGCSVWHGMAIPYDHQVAPTLR